MSEASKDDSDAASCFISLIAYKAEHDRDDIVRAWDEIEPVLKRLGLEQDYYDAIWTIYGDFRTRINEIVQQGFTVSFDTTGAERIPAGVKVADMAYSHRTLPIDVGLPILVNSGINTIAPTSTLEQVIAVLGDPDSRGGGVEAKRGYIPVWIRYHRADCLLRFEFKDHQLHRVTFMPPGTANDSLRIM